MTALRIALAALAVAAALALVGLATDALGPPRGDPWFCWTDAAGDHCSTRVPTWFSLGES